MRIRPFLVPVLSIAAAAVPGAASPVFDLSYDYIHSRTLDNGLEVVVVENHAVPIVTIELAVRNGAFTEDEELNGLSHLYEHMFFKANADIPSQEAYLARQRELGMVWNGTTGDERVNYYFTLQRRNLRPGLEFMASAAHSPLFLEDELVREREVVLGEYDRNEANPWFFFYDRMAELLWYRYPSRKDSLGDREAILDATQDEMRAMQETYYVPNNSLLVLAGDVEAEEGFAMAAEVFGGWESGPDPFVEHPIPEHPPLENDVAAVVLQPVQISAIQIAWHGPDTRGDVAATYAADVFSTILDQTSSRFQQRLVESGLALQAGLSYQTQRYVGPISLTLVVPPGGEQAALDAALDEVQHFSDPDYFDDEQLATAATLLAVDDIHGQQEVTSMAHTLTYWWASASIDYYLGYVDSLSRVTREDISRYVETYLADRPRAAVLVTSPENAAATGIDDAWLLSAITRED